MAVCPLCKSNWEPDMGSRRDMEAYYNGLCPECFFSEEDGEKPSLSEKSSGAPEEK